MLDIKSLFKAKKLRFAAISYSILITIVLLIPSSGIEINTYTVHADKIIHVLIHAILIGLWLTFIYVKRELQIDFKTIIIVLFACSLYGIIIELLQATITLTRHADGLDILANIIGALVGILLFNKLKRRIIG